MLAVIFNLSTEAVKPGDLPQDTLLGIVTQGAYPSCGAARAQEEGAIPHSRH